MTYLPGMSGYPPCSLSFSLLLPGVSLEPRSGTACTACVHRDFQTTRKFTLLSNDRSRSTHSFCKMLQESAMWWRSQETFSTPASLQRRGRMHALTSLRRNLERVPIPSRQFGGGSVAGALPRTPGMRRAEELHGGSRCSAPAFPGVLAGAPQKKSRVNLRV